MSFPYCEVRSTNSSSDHSRSVTLAAIAGGGRRICNKIAAGFRRWICKAVGRETPVVERCFRCWFASWFSGLRQKNAPPKQGTASKGFESGNGRFSKMMVHTLGKHP
jgi:hypothetical protein